MGPWVYLVDQRALSALSLSTHLVARSAPDDRGSSKVAVSPDRQRVAYTANGGLFLADAGLASPRLIDSSPWPFTIS